ncbi:hypothetical protein [uncultured Megasphaera sp.]|uniref:hypothetical protein n=1 Tax=uncultured Megasphaera sp. TaxID=165188 RepID=UPI00260B0565|nr:hypothetical protein [uncultured Megasphaera sp.]
MSNEWGKTVVTVIAPIASAITAILVYRFNQKQSQQRFRTDLYNMIVHLAGFVNHIQVLYQYHDSDLGHMLPVIENIMNYSSNHSNLLDVDQNFYYNDHFHPEIICNMGKLIQSYLSWTTFQPVKPEELFLAVNMMLKTQERALDVLKTIKVKYENDDKATSVIDELCPHIDNIYNQCTDLGNQLECICNNLAYIFYSDWMRRRLEESCNMDLDWEGIRKRIVAGCFSEVLSDEIGRGYYAKVSSFLFYQKIVENYNATMIESSDGEQISWDEIYYYLWSFIGDPSQRLLFAQS